MTENAQGPRIPGYRIEGEIGHGGMATVYLAEQESLGRWVALKVMAPVLAADRTFSERFLREARTVAQFSHPHIVAVYDVGVSGHHHYLALELVPGGDLKARIRRGPLAPEAALGIARQVAEALGYAHGKGFVHRDVKPENVLFREDGSAVLADFGIAKALGSGTRMTGTGLSIGTPHYMSPEQARGQGVDHRSDLYALGIVLYEMLTGRVPYDAEDSIAVGIQHVTEPVPQLPVALSRYQPLLDRLLAKRPDERYAQAGELIAALKRLERGEDFPSPGPTVVAAVPDPQPEPRRGGSHGRSGGAPSPSRSPSGAEVEVSSGGSSGWAWGFGGALLATVLIGVFWLLQESQPVPRAGGGAGPVVPVQPLSVPPVRNDAAALSRQPPESRSTQRIESSTGLVDPLEQTPIDRTKIFSGAAVEHVQQDAVQTPEISFQFEQQGCMGSVLVAAMDGGFSKVVAESPEMLELIAVRDFANDGAQKALVKESSCGTAFGDWGEYFIVSLDSQGRAKRTKSVSGDGHSEPEKWGDYWSIVIFKSNKGFSLDPPELVRARYVVKDDELAQVEKNWRAELPAVAEFRSSRFENKPEGLRESIDLNIGRDGGAGVFECVLWARWGVMRCEVLDQRGRPLVEEPLQGRRIGALSSRTGGMRDLVVGFDRVYRWDGQTYQRMAVEERWVDSQDQVRTPVADVIEAEAPAAVWRNAMGSEGPLNTARFDWSSPVLARRIPGWNGTFSCDGAVVFTATTERPDQLILTDVNTGKNIRRLDLPGGAKKPMSMSSDCRELVVAQWDDVLVLTLPAVDDAPTFRTFSFEGRSFEAAQFSPDGSMLIVSSVLGQGGAILVDALSLKPIRRFGFGTNDASFSPDGRQLVFADSYGPEIGARVLDKVSGREISYFKATVGESPNGPLHARFSPDGKLIAAASRDYSVWVADAQTGKTVHRLTGHGLWVETVAFSADQNLLVSGGHDRTARIWQVDTGREIAVLDHEERGVVQAEFSPDGRRLLTCVLGAQCYLWEAPESVPGPGVDSVPESTSPAPIASTEAEPAVPAAPVESVAVEPVTVAPPGGRSPLGLSFQETSWAEIRSASDAIELRGVFDRGDRRSVDVELPARVVLGNAPGVTLDLNGEAVDLAPYTRADQTARFDLGAHRLSPVSSVAWIRASPFATTYSKIVLCC